MSQPPGNYTPAPHVTQHWPLTKPSATGRRGMVVSQVAAAAEAGVAVLDAGGNAIDAAVATALALAAVEPWNSGLGGIGFALVHRAGESAGRGGGFRPGGARAALNPVAFKLTGRMKQDLFAWPEVEGDANIHGPLSFAIPSSTAGYAQMHQTWGKLPLRRGDRPRHRAGEARPAAGLVHHAEGRRLGRGAAAVSGERADLPAERAAAGRAVSGQARLLPPRQPAGDAGAPVACRAARLLRGRYRRRASPPT